MVGIMNRGISYKSTEVISKLYRSYVRSHVRQSGPRCFVKGGTIQKFLCGKQEGCRRIKDGIERLTVRENERLLQMGGNWNMFRNYDGTEWSRKVTSGKKIAGTNGSQGKCKEFSYNLHEGLLLLVIMYRSETRVWRENERSMITYRIQRI